MVNEIGLLGLLLIGSIFDYKTRYVPVILLIISAIGGIILRLCYKDLGIWNILGGIGLGVAIWLISKLTGGGIGEGDGFAILVSGIYLGFWNNLALLFYGLFLSAIFSCIILLSHKGNRKMSFPFLPFLLVAEIWRILL